MIIDLHCDTLSKLYKGVSIDDDILDINIKKLLKGDYLLQVFALYNNDINYDKSVIDKQIDIYNDIFKNNDICKYKDLIKNYQKNSFSTILALEDGGYINSIDDLIYYFNKGIKIICITWNYENSLGYPHTINKPLTKLGIEIIKKMEELNMIVCVSHLSDKGFYDVYNNTSKPFIASHSNCRSICSNTRNLTDDMIIKINERKGLIGINYYNKFVSNKDITYIDDLIVHIKHIKNIASINCISLGSDFDGIDNEVEFCSDTINIFKNRLLKEFSEEEVDKIMYKNAALFFKNFVL